MSTVLAAATLAVVLYCLGRALRGSPHHRDVDLWHVLMGSSMVAMLLVPLPRALATVVLALSALGLAWSTVRLLRRTGLGPHGRLAVGWLAMLAMVLPVAGPAAAAEAATGSGMSGMGHGHGAAAAAPAWAVPDLLVAALLVALAVVAALRAVALRAAPPRSPGRWEACCDVVMAAAMGYMLLMLL